jgi:hypothetical protein
MRIGTVWGLKVISGMAFSSGQIVGTLDARSLQAAIWPPRHREA